MVVLKMQGPMPSHEGQRNNCSVVHPRVALASSEQIPEPEDFDIPDESSRASREFGVHEVAGISGPLSRHRLSDNYEALTL